MFRFSQPILFASAVVLLSACGTTEDHNSNPIATNPPAVTPAPGKPAEPEQALAATNQAYPAGTAKSKDERQAASHATTYEMKALRSPGYAAPAETDSAYYGTPEDRERYAKIAKQPIVKVAENPVSTFSIDVDTGAYSNVRRMLQHGHLPPVDAVRIEEMINYFRYDYPNPDKNAHPFSVTTEIAPAPWNKHSHLLHIGIKAWQQQHETLPPANLVFLIDVSGSMESPDKIVLLKQALKLLTTQLRSQDKVTMVVYAGASGIVLEPTPGNQHTKIIAALDKLMAGGSTNGAAGIQLAYAKARESFVKGGINRVILATDGDFNVGITDTGKLLEYIKTQRDQGITLTTLGFGQGNYNDHMMEQLADQGNGNHAYIDNLNEARKVLVEELASTLEVVAKDTKIQIEFNPDTVAEYRLIGYENRMLEREDFNNDKVDAGDIGAGHTVTALYEITLVGSNGQRIDALRYETTGKTSKRVHSDELAFLKLRYKKPDQEQSTLVTFPVEKNQLKSSLSAASPQFRFAAAVAGFGQLLRGGQYTDKFQYTDVLKLARESRGDDPHGYRSEFLGLVQTAASLHELNSRTATR